MMPNETTIKLTQYSHGAGCGCKISPAVLDTILHTSEIQINPQLLVGNDERDDAAVYDLGNGTALIATTDFFMPIVDDPYDFGRIAAANAISDVYAMGGKPVVSLAVLGWPVDVLAPEVAQQVLEGARSVCRQAGIALAGGHSIDSPEPIFGLAVNGIAAQENLKRNTTAEPGCYLYLTKPLGAGALSTAQKKGVLQEADAALILKSMTTLNSIGERFGKMKGVKAMTDVTGFGLLGHLLEMCEGSGVAAEIEFGKIPVIPSLQKYLEAGCVPGGTNRNWSSYGEKIAPLTEMQRLVLADPQTSGGLLVAVSEDFAPEFEKKMEKEGLPLKPFGRILSESSSSRIIVH